jgi:hypothetical protein
LAGEGSHLASAKNTAASGHLPGSYPIESGVEHTQNTTGNSGLTGATARNTQQSGASGLAGNQNTSTTVPHNSNLMNKVDPRDNITSGTLTGTGQTSAISGDHNTTSSGLHNTQYGTTGSTATGPHHSNLVNRVDPRVDSNTGYNSGDQTITGSGLGNSQNTSTSTPSGHHYGRDAAVVGAAGAIGEGVHQHHQNANFGSNTGGIAHRKFFKRYNLDKC